MLLLLQGRPLGSEAAWGALVHVLRGTGHGVACALSSLDLSGCGLQEGHVVMLTGALKVMSM